MNCALCRREIAEVSNWVAVKLYGGRAEFHLACFAGFLREGASGELEQRAWLESTTAQAPAPMPSRARRKRIHDNRE
jgi:hypothetical protein